jgi:mycothiol synthase
MPGPDGAPYGGWMKGWPEGVAARPIEKTDVVAWAELAAASEKVDNENEHYSPEDGLEALGDKLVDNARDTVGLWAGDRMIGYGFVQSNPESTDVHRVWSHGTVHPDHRRQGVGGRLLDWMIVRARELHAERRPDLPGLLHKGSVDTNAGLIAMLTGAGFTAERYFREMSLRLRDHAGQDSAVPDGLRLVRYELAYDEATRLAHNEAFRDHWGTSPRDRDFWRTHIAGSHAFRPRISWLLLDGDEVASYALGYEYDAETAVTGVRDAYIGQVGTRRPYRGRGAASALLVRMLASATEEGYGTASLGVDADNPTGALGLYERLGFTVTHRSTAFIRPLP